MSSRKTISIICLGMALVISGCTKYPYEPEIQEYYRKASGKGVNILDISIDTTLTSVQARPFLEKKYERLKLRLTKTYKENYDKVSADKNASVAEINRSKERLDSANTGLFSTSLYEIQVYNELLSSKFNYEQVTVKYKVWSQGDVIKQVFVTRVSEKDTVLYITDKNLEDYLNR
jgi:hypothetical protein